MNVWNEAHYRESEYNTRRHFIKNCISGMGALTLGSMLGGDLFASNSPALKLRNGIPHFLPKVKHVIYLHLAGGPSQLELFDYKPVLNSLNGQDCPPSLMEGKRFAFIRGTPKMLGSQASFKQYGESRTW